MTKNQTLLTYISSTLQNPSLSQTQLSAFLTTLKSSKYTSNPLVQFFIGVIYHSRYNDLSKAEDYYKIAVSLNPAFAHATFALAELTLSKNFRNAEQLLLEHIFDKYTYDPAMDQTYFQPLQTLRAFTILAPHYPLAVAKDNNQSVLEEAQLKKAETMSRRVIAIVEEETLPSHRSALHYEAIKLAHQTLARVNNKIDQGSSEPSFYHYVQGLHWNTNNLTQEEKQRHNKIDRDLLQGAALAYNYFLPGYSTPKLDWVQEANRIYPGKATHPLYKKKDKIHIGYLSPDFNMNAVSLFLTAVLKHHNPNKFKLHCYYCRPECDQYTKMMMKWPHIEWHQVAYQTDEQVYQQMTQQHQLDILVDLLAIASADRMGVVAMKPAPLIINYLGYPNKAYHSAFTHRLVDHITDPEEYDTPVGETLVRLPKCFINFTLFENVPVPKIIYVPHMVEEVRIGIFNKSAKYSKALIRTWLNILEKNPRIVFYVKQDERMYRDPTARDAITSLFPPGRVRGLPILDNLTAFYEQFNQVEFTIDTFPYSGTTTTCNSLYMGCPVVTVYDPKNPHVANVSASILRHVGEEERFICKNLEEYETRILELANDLPCKDIQDKENRRNRFLNAMDPEAFMRDYEGVLEGLVKAL
jgi:hypothetical protein